MSVVGAFDYKVFWCLGPSSAAAVARLRFPYSVQVAVESFLVLGSNFTNSFHSPNLYHGPKAITPSQPTPRKLPPTTAAAQRYEHSSSLPSSISSTFSIYNEVGAIKAPSWPGSSATTSPHD
ncbi:hypothetical protein CC1G_05360 [Coprinopsis cinerea okayama7|uniref:Uncharacterized protein n=1 Tax=Coprinopsis cinerea (strain Okayama-7 / 130 / ATCC MYA-4618 / FGSC 9003) TaxID=240176 RepID=A8NPT7_COPC7|nr:hypothetical protein CC1G_05360 [Coprinopsis cinerea okayama7\|eukprot:XP_001835398.1 hypothetical protein CC1G_05360 [Coprinopsis cinerea okayama7\